jgi:FkbM family methyltransferase
LSPRGAKVDEDVEELDSFTLPDGRIVACPVGLEARSIWAQTSSNPAYRELLAGVERGEVIVDIGAHIGLTAIFFADHAPGSRLLAFEPAPRTFACLRANVARYVPDGAAFNVAIGSAHGAVDFTSFSLLSTMSTLYPDDADDRRNLDAVLDYNQAPEEVRLELQRLRSARTTVTVSMTTLSRVCEEEGVRAIGLLKIDVERAELEVLRGIDAEVWPGIRTLFLEVHDIDGRLDRVTGLLRDHGYEVRSFREAQFAAGSVRNVVARRPLDWAVRWSLMR